MADEFIYRIEVIFTIEVEHQFSLDEIKDAGGVKEAFELLEEQLLFDINTDCFLNATIDEDSPSRRNKKNIYTYSFSTSFNMGFDEKEVHLVKHIDEASGTGDDLSESVLEGIEKEYRQILEPYYTVKHIQALEGMLMEIEEAVIEVPPEGMASRLAEKYSLYLGFFITLREVERIAAPMKVGEEYIQQVDVELRKQGCFLFRSVLNDNRFGIMGLEEVEDWDVHATYEEEQIELLKRKVCT